MSKGQVWFLAPFYCVIDNFLKSLKISCRAGQEIQRVKEEDESEEPTRNIINMMLALQGIAILIAILVPKSISLNILQLLTNTFNGWWQTGDLGVNWNGLLWVPRDRKQHICLSSGGSAFHHCPALQHTARSCRSSGCVLDAPTHQGCRPSGSLQILEAEGKRNKHQSVDY